jgi:hypothetical protein
LKRSFVHITHNIISIVLKRLSLITQTTSADDNKLDATLHRIEQLVQFIHKTFLSTKSSKKQKQQQQQQQQQSLSASKTFVNTLLATLWPLTARQLIDERLLAVIPIDAEVVKVYRILLGRFV